MTTPLVMMFIGRDKPGLVDTISRKVAEHGGDWQESRLQSGAFTGAPMFQASARLSTPEGLTVDRLRATLERLAGELMVDIAVGEEEKGA